MENSRGFLTDIRNKLKIRENFEWGNITLLQLEENGGRGLVNKYRRSLYSTLSSIFPGTVSLIITNSRQK